MPERPKQINGQEAPESCHIIQQHAENCPDMFLMENNEPCFLSDQFDFGVMPDGSAATLLMKRRGISFYTPVTLESAIGLSEALMDWVHSTQK